ncbi:unnamed protein product [Caenorhabditis auriculariae]|uniref:Uncharacterized protein n=1 Tax=Caenorhabditis auriculariae TaxID=2777116 RepID=A0A8S1HVM1_9PELO|nr:unnamed protein product [Caenorhabditis auriculariae]
MSKPAVVLKNDFGKSKNFKANAYEREIDYYRRMRYSSPNRLYIVDERFSATGHKKQRAEGSACQLFCVLAWAAALASSNDCYTQDSLAFCIPASQSSGVMPSDVAFRARTPVVLPRSRSLDRIGNVGTLSRVTSVPNISTMRVGSNYRSSTLNRYRRDFDMLDDYNIDRYTFYTPFYWETYRFAARRQLQTDPIPNSLGHEYAPFWSRYKWYTDWLNPTYWRRYRDPNYDRPLWNNARPWQLDNVNVKGAIDLYRNGVIDFKTLDKKWIEPRIYDRRGKDWADVYLPAARYGAHRYFYSWN